MDDPASPLGYAFSGLAHLEPWPHAAVDELVECGHAGPGPGVRYARFASEPQLRKDLLADPPAGRLCIAGRVVLVDFPDGGQFVPLCQRFSGEIVAGLNELPVVRVRSGPRRTELTSGSRRHTAA